MDGMQLGAGAAATHVTLYDMSGNALAPADIAVSGGSAVTATPDGTGFNLAAASGGSGTETLTFSYTGSTPPGPLTGTIGVEILPEAEPMQYSSP